MSTSSTKSLTNSATPHVPISLDHPRLTEADSQSIRIFLLLYDQYENEVTARAKQTRNQWNYYFCVDVEYLESAIELGFIEAQNYEAYHKKKAEESNEAITLDGLDAIVRKKTF